MHLIGFTSLRHECPGAEHGKTGPGEGRIRRKSPCCCLVETRDLQNSAAEFGPTKDHTRRPDDSASVPLMVQEMDEAGEVLYFKGQGNIDPNKPDISQEVFGFGFMKEAQEFFLGFK